MQEVKIVKFKQSVCLQYGLFFEMNKFLFQNILLIFYQLQTINQQLQCGKLILLNYCAFIKNIQNHSFIILYRQAFVNSCIQEIQKVPHQNKFKILSFTLQHFITSPNYIFQRNFYMQNESPNPHQSSFNNPITDLHEIFNEKQIVQSYKPKINPHLIFQTRPKRNHQQYSSDSIILQQSYLNQFPKKHKTFAQDDFHSNLYPSGIVENFSMLDEKEQIYETYDNAFKATNQKPVYVNENMLASSSQNNDVPSRNSSLSSLSQKNQFVNIKTKDHFLHDEMLSKNAMKNNLKNNFLPIRKNTSFYSKGNSQNQMDIQNSPNLIVPQSIVNENLKHKPVQQNFFYPTKPQNKIQFNRSNSILSPQKRLNFNNFRRMDIDEEKQKREKQLKIQKIQQLGCNCKKSKCLKMYCQCFNLQIFCNQNCNCVGCCNQQSNEQHRKAVLDALTRNPKAFNEVTQKLQSTFELGIQLTEVKKGCKCKKTKCQKKYCQCFNAGQKCGKFCKCDGCQNC